MFFNGFKTAAEKHVSKMGLFHKGRYLMGIRQDNGKWTEPGGHLNPGEDPLDGAVREVKEETGIRVPKSEVKHLGDRTVKSKEGDTVHVHAYRADFDKKPRPDESSDPDKEVYGWNWIPVVKNRLPDNVNKNLHVPANKNVLHFFLGFEKEAAAVGKILKKLRPGREIGRIVRDMPNQAVQTYSQKKEDKKKAR